MPEQQPINQAPTSYTMQPAAPKRGGSKKVLAIIIIVAILALGGYAAYAYTNPSPEKIVDRMINQAVSAVTGNGIGYKSSAGDFSFSATVKPVVDSSLDEQVQSVKEELNISAPVTQVSLSFNGTARSVVDDEMLGAVDGTVTVSAILDKAYKLITASFAVDSATMPKHAYIKINLEEGLTQILPPEDASSVALINGMIGNQWLDIDIDKVGQMIGVPIAQQLVAQKEDSKKMGPIVQKGMRGLIDRGVVILTPAGDRVDVAGYSTQPFNVALDLTKLKDFITIDGPILIDEYQKAFPEKMTKEQAQAAKQDIATVDAAQFEQMSAVFNNFVKTLNIVIKVEPRSGVVMAADMAMVIIVPNEGEVSITANSAVTGLNTIDKIDMPKEAKPIEQIVGPLLGM